MQYQMVTQLILYFVLCLSLLSSLSLHTHSVAADGGVGSARGFILLKGNFSLPLSPSCSQGVV